MTTIFIDSFSGNIMQLDKKDRTELNALSVLQEHCTISTFDMTEKWKGRQEVWEFIKELVHKELITEEKGSYPWHRYELTDKGKSLINIS